MLRFSILIIAVFAALPSNAQMVTLENDPNSPTTRTYPAKFEAMPGYPLPQQLAGYKTIKLNADISHLTPNEKLALGYLIEASKHADNVFWMQSYGNKDSVLSKVTNEDLRRMLLINYGPWSRLDANKPFVKGFGPKPLGACFYPEDMTKEEYDSTLGKRNSNGQTIVIRNPVGLLEERPFTFMYNQELMGIARNLLQASEVMRDEDREFAEFLRLRSEAIMMGGYEQSDVAWLGLKNTNLDIIIGAIENYEDKLLGKRSAFESYVLIRDKAWGEKLSKFTAFLPELQSKLPVDSVYKAEKVNNELSQLAVFDAVYYAGDCNAGSKTMAVNLPNDENLQKQFGTRRSQIKNVMRAKFENIVVPIANVLIDPSQRSSVNFDAFFNDVMFHEIAHGLGIKNTISGNGTVTAALGAYYHAIEECKADVLGLFMVTQMVERGELPGKLEEYYVTFVASTFRSVRFGAGSEHGKANMITFNTLVAANAIVKQSNGTYKVNVELMKKAIEKLAGDLLVLQGNGDAEAVRLYIEKMAVVSDSLTKDLEKVNKAGIPVDLVFEQGKSVLGLE